MKEIQEKSFGKQNSVTNKKFFFNKYQHSNTNFGQVISTLLEKMRISYNSTEISLENTIKSFSEGQRVITKLLTFQPI